MKSLKIIRTFFPAPAAMVLLLALALGGVTRAHAQLLEYEGFNYSGQSLDTQNGGTGWGANAWIDPDLDTPLSNDDVSLSFPASVTHIPVGGRLFLPSAGEAERRLGTSMSLAPEGNAYYFSA